MTTVILFVLGAIIGSFLNLLALRLNSGLTLGGRSHCPHCGRTLRFFELVPILSFFFFGRRCRECRARLSWQYPLVELATALVFATVFNPLASLPTNILTLGVFSLYIVITVYDFRHKIIPDELVYPAILLSLAHWFFLGGEFLNFLVGPIFFTFFALIWLVTRGRAMGFGDAKLALSIGFLLGATQGFSAIVFSFWVGAVFGLALLAIARFYPLFVAGKHLTIKSGVPITLKSELPFAPFMVLGAWLALVFKLNLLNVSLFQ